jgi:hypothetical protein
VGDKSTPSRAAGQTEGWRSASHIQGERGEPALQQLRLFTWEQTGGRNIILCESCLENRFFLRKPEYNFGKERANRGDVSAYATDLFGIVQPGIGHFSYG